MAREARLRGKDMLLGPAINIQRIPTGGRTYEYLSEDPFLSSRLSVGYTKGVQDNGVDDRNFFIRNPVDKEDQDLNYYRNFLNTIQLYLF